MTTHKTNRPPILSIITVAFFVIILFYIVARVSEPNWFTKFYTNDLIIIIFLIIFLILVWIRIRLGSGSIYFSSNPVWETPSEDREDSRYVTSEVKRIVWERDGGKCVICGSHRDLEYDHIIPFSRGGGNSENNIQILCETCNRKKSGKIE